MRLIRYFSFAIALTLAALSPHRAAIAQSTTEASNLETLEIMTSGGARKFAVEVMRTDEERARGLMFRRFLPADRGMLFDFKTEQSVMMWMKNTYIPLDMIFIARNGLVSSIAENAEPMSERIISSGGPAYAVLEVNAGTAARMGIKRGDRVLHPLFRP